jgi:hypothetical protein
MFRPIWPSSGIIESSRGNCCYSAAIACVPSMCMYVVLGVLCSLLFSVACLVREIPSFSRRRNFNLRENSSRGARGSVLVPVLFSLYTCISDAPATPGIRLALFMNDSSIYATEKHECRVLSKIQRGLTAVGSWCECWNIKINEGKSQAIYFSIRRRILGMNSN